MHSCPCDSIKEAAAAVMLRVCRLLWIQGRMCLLWSAVSEPCMTRKSLFPQVSDMALEDYIAVKTKFARYVPHTAGRYQKKRFRKAQCPIVER